MVKINNCLAISSELATKFICNMESDAECNNIWYMNALNSIAIKRTQNEQNQGGGDSLLTWND